MTPNDIATDVSSVHDSGAINTSTNFTQTYPGPRTDDANTWD